MNDKCLMFLSSLGSHSLLRDPYIISDMKTDGSLDVLKLDSDVKVKSEMGANISREFPFWIDSEKALNLLKPFSISVGGNIVFEERFFEIHKVRAEKHRAKNMRYCYSLFDHCGIKGNMGLTNPWRMYGNFFYDRAARANVLKYMDKVFETFEGDLKPWVYYDQCNEIGITNSELNNKSGTDKTTFLIDTFCHMIDSNIAWQQIVLSVDYYLKETDSAYGTLYRHFRNGVCERMNDSSWKTWLKTECISPVHGATLDRVKRLFGEYTETTEDDAGVGGFRNMCFSADGWRPRPTAAEFQEMAEHVLNVKNVSADNGRISFEVIYGKEKTDPLDSFGGAENAHFNHFGHHLENYRDGSTQPPPDPEPTIEQRVTDLERRVNILEGK